VITGGTKTCGLSGFPNVLPKYNAGLCRQRAGAAGGIDPFKLKNAS
jgi:hypothetical protein